MTPSFGERVAEDFEHAFAGELVHSERSEFQQLDVYQHSYFGRVLMLDGFVQTTERDEFCYHEMLVHPALTARERLDRILIIGGGDGGTLRHVLMHDPTQAMMCEIDEAVVRVSREYLPSLSDGAFDDPRAQVTFADGAAFVAEHTGAFDVIIVDSTDPVGAAVVLFSEAFYRDCFRALRPGGVLVAQTGSPMYQGAEFVNALANLSAAFPIAEVYTGFVPTYPGVLWSFTTGATDEPVSNAMPEILQSRLIDRGIETRFYSPALHAAAFTLPVFVAELRARAIPASVPRG